MAANLFDLAESALEQEALAYMDTWRTQHGWAHDNMVHVVNQILAPTILAHCDCMLVPHENSLQVWRSMGAVFSSCDWLLHLKNMPEDYEGLGLLICPKDRHEDFLECLPVLVGNKKYFDLNVGKFLLRASDSQERQLCALGSMLNEARRSVQKARKLMLQ